MSVIGKPLYSSHDLPNQSIPAEDESLPQGSNEPNQEIYRASFWPFGETFSKFITDEKSRLGAFFTQIESLKDELEDEAEAQQFRAKLTVALQETASLPSYFERIQAYRRLAWGARGGAEIYSVFQAWLGCVAMPGVESTRAVEDLVGMAHLAAGERERPEVQRWLRRELKDAVVYFQDRLSREGDRVGAYQLLRAVRPVFGDEFVTPMQDAFQRLSEDELQRVDAPLAPPKKISDIRTTQLEKTVPTLLWLHQLIEGSFQQRIQEAEAKAKPIAKLTQQRQMLRDYLATVHAYLRSGKANGTEEAIEKLAADYGDRAPREFYIQLGKVFEYQVPMGDRTGISDHILQLVKSETITDPKVQARIRLSLVKRFIVDDSLARRAETGIAGMLQHLESFASSTGDRELQSEIDSLKKWKPYLQATNRVLDHTFSMEGFGISMASMFTAGLVGEIAALAAAMRMGAVTMESLSLGQKVAIGAVRFGANWAAFNASETALKSGFRLAHGDGLPTAKELRRQLVNSFFSLGGGHLAATPFAHLKQIPLAGLGRFFAFSAGMVKGEDVAAAVHGLPQSQEPFLLRFYEASLNAAFLEMGAKAGKPVSEHLLTQYAQGRNQTPGDAFQASILFLDNSAETAEAASGETGIRVTPPPLDPNQMQAAAHLRIQSQALETGGPAPSRRSEEPARGLFDLLGRKIERALHPDAEARELRSAEREIDEALRNLPIRDHSGAGPVEKWFESLFGYSPKDLFRNLLMEKYRMQEFNRGELREILGALRNGRLTEYDVAFLDSKKVSGYHRHLEGALRHPIHRWLVEAARDPLFVEKVRNTAHEISATADYLSRGILRQPDRPVLQGNLAGEIRYVLESLIQLSRNSDPGNRWMSDLDYAAELAGALCRIGLDRLDDSFFHPLHGDWQRLQAIESIAERRIAILQFVKHKAEQAERRMPRHPLPQVFEPGDPSGPAYSRSKAGGSKPPAAEAIRVFAPNGEVWEVGLEDFVYQPEQNMPQRLVNVRHLEILDNGERARIHLQGWNRSYTAELSFAEAERLGMVRRFPNGEQNVIFFGKEFNMLRLRILEGPLGEKGGQSLADEFGFKDENFLREVRKTASAGMRIEDARRAYSDILPAIEGLKIELRQAIFLQIARGAMSSGELMELKRELTEGKISLSATDDGLGFFRVSLTRPLTIDEVLVLTREFEHSDRADFLPEPPERFGSDPDRALAYQAIAPQLDKLPVMVKRLIVHLVNQGRLTEPVARELGELIDADEFGIDLSDRQSRSLEPVLPSKSKLAVGLSVAGERYVLQPYDPAKDTYNPAVMYGVPSRGQIMNSVHGAPVELLFNTWQGSDRSAGTLSLSLAYRDCMRLRIPLRPDGKLDQSNSRNMPSFILIPETPAGEPTGGNWEKLGFGPAWRGIISFGAGIATLFSSDSLQAAVAAATPAQESGALPAILATGAMATLAMASSFSGNLIARARQWLQQTFGRSGEALPDTPDDAISRVFGVSDPHPYREIGRAPLISTEAAVRGILGESVRLTSGQSNAVRSMLRHGRIDSLEAAVNAIADSAIHPLLKADFFAALGANSGVHSVEPILQALQGLRGDVQDSYLIMGIAELATNPNVSDAASIVRAVLELPVRPYVHAKALALIGSSPQIVNIAPMQRFIEASDLEPEVKLQYLGSLAAHPNYSDFNRLLRDIHGLPPELAQFKPEILGTAGAHPGVENVRPILSAIAQTGASHDAQAWAVHRLLNKRNLHQFSTIFIFLGSLKVNPEIMLEVLVSAGNHPELNAIDPVIRMFRGLELTPSEKVEGLTRLLEKAKPQNVDMVLNAIENLATPEQLVKALGAYASNRHIVDPVPVLRRIQSLNVDQNVKTAALALAGSNPHLRDLLPFLQIAEQSFDPEREVWLAKMLETHPQEQDLIFQSLRRMRQTRGQSASGAVLPVIGAGLLALFAASEAQAALSHGLAALGSADCIGWLALGAAAMGVAIGSRGGRMAPYREAGGVARAEIDVGAELRRLQAASFPSADARVLAIATSFQDAAIQETAPILAAILQSEASPREQARAIGIFARNTNIHDFDPIREALRNTGASAGSRAAVLGFIASQWQVREVEAFMEEIRQTGASANQIANALADAGRNPNWRDALPLAREIAASGAGRNEKLLALETLGKNPNLRDYRELLEMIVAHSDTPFLTTGAVGRIIESAEIGDVEPFLTAIREIGAAPEIQAIAFAKLAANPGIADIAPVLAALEATGSSNLKWDLLRLVYQRPDLRPMIEGMFRRHAFEPELISDMLQSRPESNPSSHSKSANSWIGRFAERAALGLINLVDRLIPDPEPPAFLKFMNPSHSVQPPYLEKEFGVRIAPTPVLSISPNPADLHFEMNGGQWKVTIPSGELWILRREGGLKYLSPGWEAGAEVRDGDTIMFWREGTDDSPVRTQTKFIFRDPHRFRTHPQPEPANRAIEDPQDDRSTLSLILED